MPSCESELIVPKWYSWFQLLITFVATGLVAYALGARGTAWFIAVIVGQFPIGVLVSMITERIFPKKIMLNSIRFRRPN